MKGPQALCHKLTGEDHKMIQRIYLANDRCRRQFVEQKEKEIDLRNTSVIYYLLEKHWIQAFR